MEAYLDNSATTRCSESVRDIMLQVMMEDYGNPSSLHLMGKKAEDYIKEAREIIERSEATCYYEPQNTEEWSQAYARYCQVTKRQEEELE